MEMELTFTQRIFDDALFAAMASIGFSSISHTPVRVYPVCALAAAIGHSLRFMLVSPQFAGINIIIAATIAALTVGLTAVLLAPRVKCPAEVCLFPALLPMIPGMYAYRCIEALLGCLSCDLEEQFSHYMYQLGYNGLTCVFVVIGMVLGANIPIFMLKKISFQATR